MYSSSYPPDDHSPYPLAPNVLIPNPELSRLRTKSPSNVTHIQTSGQNAHHHLSSQSAVPPDVSVSNWLIDQQRERDTTAAHYPPPPPLLPPLPHHVSPVYLPNIPHSFLESYYNTYLQQYHPLPRPLFHTEPRAVPLHLSNAPTPNYCLSLRYPEPELTRPAPTQNNWKTRPSDLDMAPLPQLLPENYDVRRASTSSSSPGSSPLSKRRMVTTEPSSMSVPSSPYAKSLSVSNLPWSHPSSTATVLPQVPRSVSSVSKPEAKTPVSQPVRAQSQEVPSSPASQTTIATPVALTPFHKGSWVALAGGSFKKVEDLTGEDFTTSAQATPSLRLQKSTVVELRLTPNARDQVSLVFNVEGSTCHVTLTTTSEQPFFVMGRGWCSVQPSLSEARYKLHCGTLEPGDVVVALASDHANMDKPQRID